MSRFVGGIINSFLPFMISEPSISNKSIPLFVVLKHIARSHHSFNSHHLLLSDNMSVCLSLSKGRCADPHLLQFCRRACALSLATNSRLTARWFPSEWSLTDHASRVFEKGTPAPSHILQALPRCTPSSIDMFDFKPRNLSQILISV